MLLYLLELGQLELLVALLHKVLLQVLVAHFLNVCHLHLIYRLDVDRFVDSVVQLEVEELGIELLQLFLSQVAFLFLVEAADVLM